MLSLSAVPKGLSIVVRSVKVPACGWTVDWTIDKGAKMQNAAFAWAKGSKEIKDFVADSKLDCGNVLPGTCNDIGKLDGPMLCKEEGYEANFGDGEEQAKVRGKMVEVAIAFMKDQCQCTEPYKPPSELAEQLAVWLWDAARVQKWMKEKVGILEKAEPRLFGGKIEGKLLLMKFDAEPSLFEGVVFEDGKKGKDMVREKLEGQCLSFFDAIFDDDEATANKKKEWVTAIVALLYGESGSNAAIPHHRRSDEATLGQATQ